MPSASAETSPDTAIEPWLDVLYDEPEYVPGPSDAKFFLGAQVGYSVERDRPPIGDEVCPLCKGDVKSLVGAGGVCSKCHAWTADAVLVGVKAVAKQNRGDWQPVEKATVRVEGYDEPFRPSDIDQDRKSRFYGRPLAEKYAHKPIQFTPRGQEP